jgi:hypothetical protein
MFEKSKIKQISERSQNLKPQVKAPLKGRDYSDDPSRLPSRKLK